MLPVMFAHWNGVRGVVRQGTESSMWKMPAEVTAKASWLPRTGSVTIHWRPRRHQAGETLHPVIAAAAAAAVLCDVDLTGLRADVDEVAEVADPRGCIGVG